MERTIGVLLLFATFSDALAFDCWKASLGGEKGNAALLCIDKSKNAEFRFYFSNRGSNAPSTACSAGGNINPGRNGNLVIKVGVGKCDNGRELGESELFCRAIDAQVMTCDVRGETWEFRRVYP